MFGMRPKHNYSTPEEVVLDKHCDYKNSCADPTPSDDEISMMLTQADPSHAHRHGRNIAAYL